MDDLSAVFIYIYICVCVERLLGKSFWCPGSGCMFHPFPRWDGQGWIAQLPLQWSISSPWWTRLRTTTPIPTTLNHIILGHYCFVWRKSFHSIYYIHVQSEFCYIHVGLDQKRKSIVIGWYTHIGLHFRIWNHSVVCALEVDSSDSDPQKWPAVWGPRQVLQWIPMVRISWPILQAAEIFIWKLVQYVFC